jgi:hypothetical protein
VPDGELHLVRRLRRGVEYGCGGPEDVAYGAQSLVCHGPTDTCQSNDDCPTGQYCGRDGVWGGSGAFACRAISCGE